MYRNLCFNPKYSFRILGKKVRNPNIIIIKLIIATVLIFSKFSFVRHTKRATKGDAINNGIGKPVMLCSFNGIGNIAGPAIKEYSDSNSIAPTPYY